MKVHLLDVRGQTLQTAIGTAYPESVKGFC